MWGEQKSAQNIFQLFFFFFSARLNTSLLAAAAAAAAAEWGVIDWCPWVAEN